MAVEPFCDIVIPTHNRAAFLPDCIASVRDSGLPYRHIIVVDDGSTDDTHATLNCLAASDLISLRHDSTRGPAAARNTAVRNSTAEFIAFLDDDDRFMPGMHARLLALLTQRSDVDLAFGDLLFVTEDGRRETAFGQKFLRYFRYFPIDEVMADGCKMVARDLVFAIVMSPPPMWCSATIVRREALLAAGGFDESIMGPEDRDCWVRMLERGRCAYLDAPAWPLSRCGWPPWAALYWLMSWLGPRWQWLTRFLIHVVEWLSGFRPWRG